MKRLGLIGIGPEAINTIEAAAPMLLMRLSEKYGAVAVQRVPTECGLKHSLEPKHYIASRLVVARDAASFQRLMFHTTTDALRSQVQALILKGLQRQYNALQEAFGDAFGPPMSEDDWTYQDIKILGVGPLQSTQLKPGGSIYSVIDAAFSAHFELQGQWNVGRLVNPGLGHAWYAALPPDFDSWEDYLANGRGRQNREIEHRERALASASRYATKKGAR